MRAAAAIGDVAARCSLVPEVPRVLRYRSVRSLFAPFDFYRESARVKLD